MRSTHWVAHQLEHGEKSAARLNRSLIPGDEMKTPPTITFVVTLSCLTALDGIRCCKDWDTVP